MVQGYTQEDSRSEGGWPSLPGSRKSSGGKAFTKSIKGSKDFFGLYTSGVAHEQWYSSHPEESKLSGLEVLDREAGGLMLSVTGITRFY